MTTHIKVNAKCVRFAPPYLVLYNVNRYYLITTSKREYTEDLEAVKIFLHPQLSLSNRASLSIRWNGGDRPQRKRDTGPRRSERRPLWRLFVSEKNNRYTTPFRRKEKASDFSVKKDTKIGKPNGKISTSGRHTHIASFTIDPYDSAKLASGDQAEQERQHPLLSQRYLR
jgi:hypothetical protein